MRHRSAAFAFAAFAAFAAVAVGGCGSSSASKNVDSATSTSSAASARSAAIEAVSIRVDAAASLTEAFKAEKVAFEASQAGVTVTLNFAGTQTLVQQITEGDAVDVFASADQANMTVLVDAKLVDAAAPTVFTRNRLEIVVPAGNPMQISTLADLARPGVGVALCGEAVPAGKYARQALGKAGVKVTPKTSETDVKAVVAKTASGEVDAGIVYATDVRAGGAKVAGVEIPEDQNVQATYPIAALAGSKHGAASSSFVEFVLSAEGQRILGSFGFAPPSA